LAPPNFPSYLGLYIAAFLDLDTERTGTDAIPWSSIYLWCQAHGLNDQQTEDMKYFIRVADNAVSEKREKDAERKNGNASRPRK
jgi:hypothetical protein